MESYYRMEKGGPDWKAFIDLYQPGTIVWPTNTASPLPQLFSEGDEWCLAFDGKQSIEGYSVFTRCGADKSANHSLSPTGVRDHSISATESTRTSSHKT